MDDWQDGGNAHLIVDRGWGLRVGAFQLTRWHRRYSVRDDASETPGRTSRSLLFSPRAALGGMVICTLSFTAASLLVERVGARPTYAINIPVPPRERTSKTVRHTPIAHLHHAADLPAVALVKKQARERLRYIPSHGHMPIRTVPPNAEALDAPRPPDTLTSEVAQVHAIKAAMSTGDMQEWTDDAAGIYGFVVAGPLRAEGGQRCRAMAVLIRTIGKGDQVEQRHECL